MTDNTTSSVAVNALQVEVEIAIQAPRNSVWRAMVHDTTAWWPHDFMGQSGGTHVKLEPWPGGRIYEEGANGSGLLWAQVIALDPPNSMHWTAQISPPWGGPATSFVHFKLVDDDNDGCILKISDWIMGCEVHKMAQNLDSGWRHLFETGLKAYVETQSSPAPASSSD